MAQKLLARRLIGWLLLPLLLLGALGAWLVFDPGFRGRYPTSAVATDLPKDEFDRRVGDYLMAHPDVIMQSVNQLEARQKANEDAEAQTVLKSHADEILRDPASPSSGNQSGNVTLVEFFDYNCPYCRQMTPIMTKAEEDDPQLRIVYKEFPVLGPNSTFAARAALAANKQGKYVAFHRALYQVRGAVDQGKALEAAATVGLDVARLKTDMEDPSIQAAINKNLALAQALRINGTPGFVIGDEILRGATDLKTLQELIRAARENHK